MGELGKAHHLHYEPPLISKPHIAQDINREHTSNTPSAIEKNIFYNERYRSALRFRIYFAASISTLMWVSHTKHTLQ